ncbi:hypothetical protein N825_30785 [Skermanella stibiiresistens SB22]|uniref:TRAP transporter small permease protein n=1 Tax=Skermanella stibiiresistens SB22 TaxID=1385369 RepID=W9H5C0_9PROT|nr:TRAP transporter small permease [Skermanella stibiiresistens]EWY41229.1 hypothetical protein N825_30785 [Skermanella stibiiresistens SB22]
MLPFLKSCDTWFHRCLAGLCALLVAVMLVTVGAQIVMRYALNAPLVWSEELARFTMVWLALLASALAMRRAQHIAMTGLYTLPPSVEPILKALTALATILILGVLTYHGWELAERTMRQRSPALGLPMGYMYAAIPIATFLMMIGHALALITRTEPPLVEPSPDIAGDQPGTLSSAYPSAHYNKEPI